MEQKNLINKKPNINLKEIIKFLKIISDENRFKILYLLKDNKKCVCDIWQYLGLAQNLTSHHLKVLKDLELVSSKQEGLKVIYSINKKVVKKYLKLLNQYLN
jgi:ArsR family transcriptional regulator